MTTVRVRTTDMLTRDTVPDELRRHMAAKVLSANEPMDPPPGLIRNRILDDKTARAMRDTKIDGGFRIDTNTRINAELSTSAPARGTVWEGSGKNGAPTARENDADALMTDFSDKFDLLSDAEKQKCMKQVAYAVSSGRWGRTSQGGITSTDGSNTVADSLRNIRESQDHIERINEANARFWAQAGKT